MRVTSPPAAGTDLENASVISATVSLCVRDERYILSQIITELAVTLSARTSALDVGCFPRHAGLFVGCWLRVHSRIFPGLISLSPPVRLIGVTLKRTEIRQRFFLRFCNV